MSKQWMNKGWDVFIPGGGFSLRNCPDPVDNATILVACVNACAGMSDPAEDIATLKRQRDELLDFVMSCAQYQGDGTACHSTYQLIVAEMGERARVILERTGQ